jgi:YidC/Oxa1 family membrane protein insertase
MLDVFYTIIIFPATQILEFVFTFSQKIFKNPGVSIICISTAVTVLCLPLYGVAEKWQAYERNLQKKFRPKLDKIKAVFSGDERYMITTAFYRQNHYHPIYAMRSSFGLLIQIPFFIAAYAYLSNLDVLKGASFLFINNLGAPDEMLRVGNFTLNLLPILMTAVNCTAGAVYTKGFPLKEKLQLYGMAAIFLALLYASPAGLVLYWTMNNIFSLLKNIYYKITFRYKNLSLVFCFSILCFFLSFYLLRIYRGDANLKKILAGLFVLAGIGPPVLMIIKKYTGRIKFPAYSNQGAFFTFLASFASLWIITGLFLPSMLIGSSPQEFSFIDDYTTPNYFIANTALQSFGLFLFWPICLYFLFPQKIKRYFAFAGLILLISAVINIFLFPGNYGIISAALVFDNGVSHSSRDIIKNILILTLPVIVAAAAGFHNPFKIFTTVAALFMFSFLGVSFYNLIHIDREFQKVKSFHVSPHDDVRQDEIIPAFNLSQTGKNTIIIMLDRAVSVFLPYIFDESPELYSFYKGFVYYPNTVSFNGYTRMGAPPLFGGYEYTPQEINKRDQVPVVTKHNEALLMLPRIFSGAGYMVTVTDPPYPNYSTKEDLRIYEPYPGVKALITDSAYTKLWIEEHKIDFPSTSDILKRNLFWYDIFKIVPLAFRQGIYLQGDWCSPLSAQKTTLTLNGYSVLDYLPKLTGTTSEEINTALIMVNNTTHETSFLQAPEYRPVLNVTNYGNSPFKKEMAYHINAAAIKRLADWFQYLKEQNLYDNSRIIVVSDHGPEPNFVTKTGLPFNVDQFNPLLLVKDFNAEGNLRADMAFMSNADVPYLALNGQIEDPVNPFTGNAINVDAKTSPLYIAISGGIHLDDPTTTTFALDPKRDYYVHTNIFDPANWEQAEK